MCAFPEHATNAMTNTSGGDEVCYGLGCLIRDYLQSSFVEYATRNCADGIKSSFRLVVAEWHFGLAPRRDGETETTPHADFACYPYPSAVGLNDPLGYGKPQTGPSSGSGARLIHPVEPLKNVREILAGMPSPVSLTEISIESSALFASMPTLPPDGV